ncbi:MAG: iron ABC transporter substrate-binding protein [Desulfosudaceae bacterium]
MKFTPAVKRLSNRDHGSAANYISAAPAGTKLFYRSARSASCGKSGFFLLFLLVAACGIIGFPGQGKCDSSRAITDMLNRQVTIPDQVDRVICSGSGCLRLLVYLQAHDRVVGVDSAEKGGLPFAADARPYAVANPELSNHPLFGEFRGHDSPELIAALDPQPQVILKTYAARDGGVEELEQKTGLPVVALGYGDLTRKREELRQTLRLMGRVLRKEDRAEAVIAFFDEMQADLEERAAGVADRERPTTYIGGLAQRGGHGFASTEPGYEPFTFLSADNVAKVLARDGRPLDHAMVSKEQLMRWNPEIVFLDIATTRIPSGANGLEELRDDPAYRALDAVRSGRVFGVFPYNYYTQNFGSVFANAYFIGTVLYPRAFADIDPLAKAEAISEFLNGGPAYARINRNFDQMGFEKLPLKKERR